MSGSSDLAAVDPAAGPRGLVRVPTHSATPRGRPGPAHPDAIDPERIARTVTALGHAATRFTQHGVIGDRDHALREIVLGALEAISGVTHAGLTVFERGGRLTSTGPTGELVARLDQAQAVLHEGPCVTVATSWVAGPATGAATTTAGAASGHDEPVVWIDEMADAGDGGRWPRFAREAIRSGVRSMISVRLPSDRRDRAVALNLYADRAGVFDPAARAAAALFVGQAGIALLGAERAADLGQALASRDLIGQAKGILMERHQLSSDDAFAMLVEASQNANIKLIGVARWLVDDTATGPPVRPVRTAHSSDHRGGGAGPSVSERCWGSCCPRSRAGRPRA